MTKKLEQLHCLFVKLSFHFSSLFPIAFFLFCFSSFCKFPKTKNKILLLLILRPSLSLDAIKVTTTNANYVKFLC